MQETLLNPKNSENSLRDFYNVIFRHKYKLILFFVAVIVAVVLSTLLMPDIFQSDAKLLVQIGRESINLDPTAPPGRGQVSISQNRENELNSELEILTSEELAGKVVDAIGVSSILEVKIAGENESPSPEKPEQDKKRHRSIKYLMKNLTVEVVKKSNIIALAYKAKTPQLAADVLSTLIDYYLEKRFSVYRTEGAYNFFKNQKEKLYNDLAQTEEKIRKLKSETNIGSLEEQRPLLLERIDFLQKEINSSESELAVSEAKVAVLETTLASLPERLITKEITGGPLSAADQMRAAVNELQLKENEILATFTEKSVFAQEIRRQIRDAKNLLGDAIEAKSVEKGINQVRQQLKLDLTDEEATRSSLKSKAKTLRQQIRKAQGELKKIIDTEVLLSKLYRDKEVEEYNYRKYSRNLEQSRIDMVLEQEKISNIRMFQAPTIPSKPISPRPLLNLVLGLCLGIFGGLGLVLITDYLDHSFKKPEDIEEKLHIPVLGSIPALYNGGTSFKGKEIGLPTKFNASSLLKKHCEILLERFLVLTKDRTTPQRVFSITSCHTGEGVSTISAYFASTLADRGNGRTLLVDANLYNPLVHRIFGVKLSPGLEDILDQGHSQAAIIQPSSVNNLDLLCAGRSDTADKTRLFKSKIFFDLLNYWRNEYSFVVLDTPAVWDENFAVSLGSVVDGIILVIEAEKMRWEVALRAKERLTKDGEKVIGGVLNKRRFYVPEWLYKTL